MDFHISMHIDNNEIVQIYLKIEKYWGYRAPNTEHQASSATAAKMKDEKRVKATFILSNDSHYLCIEDVYLNIG